MAATASGGRAIKHVTVVGGGTLGAQVAWRLLQAGRKVLVLDAGSVAAGATGRGRNSDASRDQRPHAQNAWGWHRRYSLQPKAKAGRGCTPSDVGFDDVNMNSGPMLMSTRRASVVDKWQGWVASNPKSDAHILTPAEAEQTYGIDARYFGGAEGSSGAGGVFVCDSRDCILDYTALTAKLWAYMANHPNCEIHPDTKVDGIGFDPSRSVATHLKINGADVAVDQVLMATGHQSSRVLPIHPPVMNLNLPYGFLETTPDQPYRFAGLWSAESTLTCFGNGDVKVSNGLTSMLSLKQALAEWKAVVPALPAFAALLKRGAADGLRVGWNNPTDKIMALATAELGAQGLLSPGSSIVDVQVGTVDVTPSLCPYVDRLPYARNVLLATGLSGSGSLALDPWFSKAVATALNQGQNSDPPKLLRPFKVPKSLTQHWNPHPDLLSPTSPWSGKTD